mgnify:FL=1
MTRKEELILDVNNLINKTKQASNQIKTIVALKDYNLDTSSGYPSVEKLYNDSLIKLKDLESSIQSLRALFVLYSVYGERSPNKLQERDKDD